MSRGYAFFTPDLSILPVDLLELKDKAFYELVKELTSSDEAELLELQSIRSVHTFMRVNPLNIFHLDSKDLVPLQSRLAHKRADGKYIVHAGIRGNMAYLTELFNSFKKQKMKEAQIKVNKLINTTNITVTPIHSTPFEDASILDTSTSDIVPLVHHPAKKKVISASDQRTHIEQCIKIWWNNVREKYNLVSQNLLEPNDYNLVLTNDSGSIICSCGISIVLRCPDGRTHYQLSNYYQHILRNERCNVMKRKQKDQREINDMNDSHSNEPQTTIIQQPAKRQNSSISVQHKSKKTRTR